MDQIVEDTRSQLDETHHTPVSAPEHPGLETAPSQPTCNVPQPQAQIAEETRSQGELGPTTHDPETQADHATKSVQSRLHWHRVPWNRIPWMRLWHWFCVYLCAVLIVDGPMFVGAMVGKVSHKWWIVISVFAVILPIAYVKYDMAKAQAQCRECMPLLRRSHQS
ncbi:hypothetical protein AURDEDRAFT_176173 [Auricularia subglabra TFB-10046 SS5]|uniref:Uncharacterized protein n=1 Tax=Auricularia subglabra (strain TFB-10046 / SS5) TaxID=717982 RepID=J0CW71_AURST|nr:hypothetical protein AURDEDRAFT_176173 [Auricularia subglabra TFB-10046 SS5]